MDHFSIEELNLLYIYDTSSRKALLNCLTTGIKSIYDPEMIDIFKSSIQKLESLTDDEFAGMGFYFADDMPWEVYDVCG